MIINILNEQNALQISLDSTRKLVERVIKEEGQTCDEVTVYFIDTQAMCDLHQEFFNDPSPTDCISFPMDEEEDLGYRVLGDVFVCPETAIRYAEDHQLDPLEETSLYIVHGLLHLMGYDDIDENDREEMRRAEKLHMSKLKKTGFYLGNHSID